MHKLTGARLSGGCPLYGRQEHDFYATPKESVIALLENYIKTIFSTR